MKKKENTQKKAFLLATLYESKKDTINANAYFFKALGAPGADSGHIYYLLSMTYYHRDNILTAKDQLVTALHYDPSQAQWHFILGKFYDYLKNKDSAISCYQDAYNLEPENLNYIQAMYSAFRNKGMIRESLPLLEKWAKIDSTTLQSRLTLAVQWIDLDSFTKAASLLRLLNKDFPANDSIYYNLAICALELGDSVTGLQTLRQAINLSPHANAQYYDLLINVYEAEGQLDQMLATIQQAAQKGLSNYVTWLNVYETSRRETKRVDSILTHDTKPEQLKDLFLLATLSLFQKDDANTLNRIKEYLQWGGLLTDSLLYIKCIAELGLGHLSGAKTSIQEAIKISPSNSEYKALFATILYRSKNYNELTQILQNLSPGGNTLFDAKDQDALLFKSYTLLGDTGKALQFYHND